MNRIVRAVPFRHASAQYLKSSSRWALHVVLSASLVLIASCSGGGGSNPVGNGGTPTPTPLPTPTPRSFVKPLAVNPEVVSKGVASNASHLTPHIAFNQEGAGIAIWSVITGNGSRVLYAMYDAATKSWSPEETITTLDGVGTGPDPHVISNGQTFLLAWRQGQQLYARIVTPGAPSLGSDTRRLDEDTSLAVYDSLGLATDGNTYLVVWNNPSVYARLYSNDTWSPHPELIGPTDHSSGYSHQLPRFIKNVVSGSAAGYVTAWIETGDGDTGSNDVSRIRTNVYSSNTATWIGVSTVATEGGYVSDLAMASNDIGHALNWTIGSLTSSSSWSDTTRVSMMDIRALQATWNTPTTLSAVTQSQPSGRYAHAKLAASKTEFVAIWIEKDNSTAPLKLLTSHFSLESSVAAWRSTAPIAAAKNSSGDPEIIGSDVGFACVWRNDAGLVRGLFSAGSWSVEAPIAPPIAWSRLATFANQYALAYGFRTFATNGVAEEQTLATESSGSQWNTPIAVLPAHREVSLSYPIDPTVAGSPWGFWYAVPLTAADTLERISNIVIRRPNALPNGVEKLALQHYRGSADTPVLASNSSGDLLAVWSQYDDTLNILYAAVRHASVWSTPTRLNTSNSGVYIGGISKTSIRVAANGNSFAVVWTDESGVNIRTFDGSKAAGTQWEAAPRRVGSNSLNTRSAALTLYKTGYALTWIQRSLTSSVRSVELATLLNGTWRQFAAETITTEIEHKFSEVAVGKDNALLVAWSTTDAQESSSLKTRLWKDGVWSNPGTVSTTIANDLKRLTLQSTTSGDFALYWQNYNNQLFASLSPSNAMTWATPQELSSQGDEFASVAGAGKHVAAWFSSGALEASQALSNEWQALAPMKNNWQPGDTSIPQPRMIELGDTILYAWNAIDNQNYTLGLGKLVGDTWTEAFAIGDFGTGTIQRHDPSLARFGDGAALAWAQYDRSTDASVTEIVVQPALF